MEGLLQYFNKQNLINFAKIYAVFVGIVAITALVYIANNTGSSFQDKKALEDHFARYKPPPPKNCTEGRNFECGLNGNCEEVDLDIWQCVCDSSYVSYQNGTCNYKQQQTWVLFLISFFVGALGLIILY